MTDPYAPVPDAYRPAPGPAPVPRPPAPPSTGAGWTVVALLSLWPFGLLAYPHTQRATAALAAGDLEQAAAEGARARRAGIAGLVVAIVLTCVLTVALTAGTVGLAVWLERQLGPAADRPHSGYPADDVPGSGPAEGTSVWELHEGDCYLTDGLTDVVRTVAVVPCDQPHGGELFDITYVAASALEPADDAGDPEYPGDPWMARYAAQVCRDSFEEHTGSPADDAGLHLWHTAPDAWDWRAEGRRIACLAESDTALTGQVGDR